MKKCGCCERDTEVIIKDYRTDSNGNGLQFFVCPNCLCLDNHWFFKLLKSKDKEKLIKEYKKD